MLFVCFVVSSLAFVLGFTVGERLGRRNVILDNQKAWGERMAKLPKHQRRNIDAALADLWKAQGKR